MTNAELYFIQKFLKNELKKFGYKIKKIKMKKSDLLEFDNLCNNPYLLVNPKSLYGFSKFISKSENTSKINLNFK